MGRRVIIYWKSRIIQEIEGRQPPCLIPTLESNPHWLLALTSGGLLYPTTCLPQLLFHQGVSDRE